MAWNIFYKMLTIILSGNINYLYKALKQFENDSD